MCPPNSAKQGCLSWPQLEQPLKLDRPRRGAVMYLVLELRFLTEAATSVTQLQSSPLRFAMLEQTNQYCQSRYQLVILTVDPAEMREQVQQFKNSFLQ